MSEVLVKRSRISLQHEFSICNQDRDENIHERHNGQSLPEVYSVKEIEFLKWYNKIYSREVMLAFNLYSEPTYSY